MPNIPYIIYGKVYKPGGSATCGFARVLAVNDSKGSVTTTTTDSNGNYVLDLANSPGYDNGDRIYIQSYWLFSRHIISDLAMTQAKDYKFTIDIEISNSSLGNSLVPDAGLNALRNYLTGTATTAPTHVAWGTGTTLPVAGDTTIETEEERNAIGSTRIAPFNKVTFEAILATTEANGSDITESGVLNAASAGTLWGRAVYGSLSKTSLFQVHEIDTYTIT